MSKTDPFSNAKINTEKLWKVPHPLADDGGEGSASPSDNGGHQEEPMSCPEVGQEFVEKFGDKQTKVKRVTDTGFRHEYSRHDPFNKNRSMIILETPDSRFKVYRTKPPQYDAEENFVRPGNPDLPLEEPRWDRENENLVIGIDEQNELKIVKFDVTKWETTEVVKDFSKDPVADFSSYPEVGVGEAIKLNAKRHYSISMKGEGEPSYDGKWWAFILREYIEGEDYRPPVDRSWCIFCWGWDSISKEYKVLGLRELEQNQTSIDWVGMSPKGNWVLIGGMCNNAEPMTGLTMANRELTEFHRIDYTTSHADVGLDGDGHEVVVMKNDRTDYIDMITLPSSSNTPPTEEIPQPILASNQSYERTHHVRLVHLLYDEAAPNCWTPHHPGGVHISCNVNGYALVSASTDVPPHTEKNWLERSIILVKLNPQAPQLEVFYQPEAFYLAKTHNTTGNLWEETQATITNDGASVVWAANFKEHSKEYVLQLSLLKKD